VEEWIEKVSSSLARDIPDFAYYFASNTGFDITQDMKPYIAYPTSDKYNLVLMDRRLKRLKEIFDRL
jgi:hypothetical protein